MALVPKDKLWSGALVPKYCQGPRALNERWLLMALVPKHCSGPRALDERWLFVALVQKKTKIVIWSPRSQILLRPSCPGWKNTNLWPSLQNTKLWSGWKNINLWPSRPKRIPLMALTFLSARYSDSSLTLSTGLTLKPSRHKHRGSKRDR